MRPIDPFQLRPSSMATHAYKVNKWLRAGNGEPYYRPWLEIGRWVYATSLPGSLFEGVTYFFDVGAKRGSFSRKYGLLRVLCRNLVCMHTYMSCRSREIACHPATHSVQRAGDCAQYIMEKKKRLMETISACQPAFHRVRGWVGNLLGISWMHAGPIWDTKMCTIPIRQNFKMSSVTHTHTHAHARVRARTHTHALTHTTNHF